MLWWWLAMFGVALGIFVLGAIVSTADARFAGGAHPNDVR